MVILGGHHPTWVSAKRATCRFVTMSTVIVQKRKTSKESKNTSSFGNNSETNSRPFSILFECDLNERLSVNR
eukprot:1192476-Prorocentrum_minimum.AAC.1